MAWDTLLVDGTDLSTLAVLEDLSELATVPSSNADPLKIPGRAGALFVAGQPDTYSFNVPMVVLGDDWGSVREGLRDLLALLDSSSAALTITRRTTVGTAQVAETASCVVTGTITPQYLGSTAARVVVTFQNLDGAWTLGSVITGTSARSTALGGTTSFSGTTSTMATIAATASADGGATTMTGT